MSLSLSTRDASLTRAAARGRARIALAILESAEALDHASEMVDRLDGAYIHEDDWDEEGLPWLAWDGEDAPTPGGDPSPRARPTRMTQPRPRVDEAGAQSSELRAAGGSGAPSLVATRRTSRHCRGPDVGCSRGLPEKGGLLQPLEPGRSS